MARDDSVERLIQAHVRIFLPVRLTAGAVPARGPMNAANDRPGARDETRSVAGVVCQRLVRTDSPGGLSPGTGRQDPRRKS